MKSIKSISKLSAVSLAMALVFASVGAFVVFSPGSVTPSAVQPLAVVGTDNASTAVIGAGGPGAIAMSGGIGVGKNDSHRPATLLLIGIGSDSIAMSGGIENERQPDE